MGQRHGEPRLSFHYIHILLLFVPVSLLASHYQVGDAWVFGSSCLAVVPLAILIGDATELAITQIEALPTAPWPAGIAIGPGALVEIVEGREHSWYYVAPRAGGTEIDHQQHEILVLTPQSPLGQQLVGRRQGDEIVLDLGRGSTRRLRVATVG